MHAEAINLIQQIEKSFDTETLQYRGISYWPLCRLKLWGGLMKTTVLASKEGDPAKVSNTAPSWSDAGTINAEPFGPPALGLLRAHPRSSSDPITPEALNPKALLFVRPEEYSDNCHGASYAKTLDSVYETARSEYGCTKIELGEPRIMGFSRYHPSLFLHLGMAAQGVRFDPPGELENFEKLIPILDELNLSRFVIPSDISTDMGKIFYFARIFEKLLKHLNPKALFLSVYYHPVGMAWMLACRWAGVKSIDLQHGRLGPHHGAYTQLTAAPRDGYHLLPDVVWCWGEQTKHDVEIDKNPICERHGGIVGGNAWLNKWRYGDTSGLEPPEAKSFAEETSDKKKILVSLQPLDSPLNAALLEAMQKSPADWLWLMRLHPLRRHTAPEIEAILKKNGTTNYEIDRATTLPLFSILKITDHHVTIFSSVVVEAAAFGVRTSLIGIEGKDIFKSYIDRRICQFTRDSKDLMNHIIDSVNGNNELIQDGFLDFRETVVAEALSELL